MTKVVIPGFRIVPNEDALLYASDTFTGGDRADLVGHVFDNGLGGSGELTWAGTATALAISGGSVVRGAGSAAWAVGAPVAAADFVFDVRVDQIPAGTASLFIEGRANGLGSGRTAYRVLIGNGSGVVTLAKRFAGATTNLSANVFTMTPGDWVGVRIIGDQVSLTRNGVVVATVTDTDMPAAGHVTLAGAAGTAGVLVGAVRIRDLT